MATKYRVVTSDQAYRFRQSCDGVRINDPHAKRTYMDKNMPSHMRYASELDDESTFGRPNRPSTPMRTVVNGVYGTVAEFEIENRTTDIVSQKKAEKRTGPSKAHTRASTMAEANVLKTTLAANFDKQ